jgi:hypothetical protein
MSTTARKTAIAVLLVLTIALIGLSIFVGYKLNQTPDVSVGAGCCGPIECSDGRTAGDDANTPHDTCPLRAQDFCDDVAGATVVIDGSNYNQCDSGGETCNVRATASSVIVSNCGDKKFTLFTFTRRMTGPTDTCFVNQNDVQPGEREVGNGTYTPSPGKCFCQQIDIEWNGTKGAKASGGWDESCEGTSVRTFNCNNNNQCVAVNGTGGQYSTRASCETACAEVVQCGGECDTDDQCPTDHSCSTDGACVLDQCADDPESCTDDQCLPLASCGEDCSSNDQCPNDHTCSNGTCTLTSCVGNANCTNNGCTLPDTAFGDEPYHYISTGLLFLLLAFVINRYGIVNKLTLSFVGIGKLAPKRTSAVEKERRKFEDKFSE